MQRLIFSFVCLKNILYINYMYFIIFFCALLFAIWLNSEDLNKLFNN